MSLLLSSSLVAGIDSVIASDFSGFLPFLKGGAAGGVFDDIALWPPQSGRTQSGEKEERVSRCSSSLRASSSCCWQVYIIAGGFWEFLNKKGKMGKRVSQCYKLGYVTRTIRAIFWAQATWHATAWGKQTIFGPNIYTLLCLTLLSYTYTWAIYLHPILVPGLYLEAPQCMRMCMTTRVMVPCFSHLFQTFISISILHRIQSSLGITILDTSFIRIWYDIDC